MRWWDERVVPRVVERSLSVGEVMKRREAVCADLRGRVLEVGFGSGLNVEKYPGTIAAVDAVEPSSRRTPPGRCPPTAAPGRPRPSGASGWTANASTSPTRRTTPRS